MKASQKKIILAVLLFVLSLGLSYVFFTFISPIKKAIVITPPQKLANGSLGFDDSLPKTQACPLNGMLYSTQQEAWWQKHRPLGVMIENHQEARPQSGLSFADVVYEAVAEGGITRFLALYYCNDAPQVGPVRSARTYFVDFVSEYADYPLYAHVGGANADGPADALGQISSYGWDGYNDLNQFSIGFPTYWRDYDRLGHTVATEHTMYSTTTKLWDVGKSRDLTNVDKDGASWDTKFVKYTFKYDSSAKGSVKSIHIPFWDDSNYAVDWTYDSKTNLFKRSNGGTAHIDMDTKKQLTAKNVVVLYMQESNADDGYENNVHLLYVDKGTGKATIFMDGKQVAATWKKASRTARTLLSDASGNPIVFDRGVIWFEVVSTTTQVTVK
jgi:hypothetical protein